MKIKEQMINEIFNGQKITVILSDEDYTQITGEVISIDDDICIIRDDNKCCYPVFMDDICFFEIEVA